MAPRKLDADRLADDLLRLLRQNGPSDAPTLYGRLGISQPVFSRLVGRLTERLVIAGRTRGRRYAARRSISGLPARVPVYEIGGAPGIPPRRLLDLHPIEPSGFFGESHVDEHKDGFYRDLPYFLYDLMPAGFLGRLVPKQHPELALPPDIRNWTATDTLRYVAKAGWNLPGNLIVGELAYELFVARSLEPVDLVRVEEQTGRYPELAQRVLLEGVPGSSAAGEQPKFLATRVDAGRRVPVLVKFSPPAGERIGQRTADLLICEHLVHTVLRGHDQPSASSSILRAGGRTLEVERFDRVGASHRRGTISLHALDAELVGELASWSGTTAQLARLSVISEATHRSVCWLEHFGRLIGNTDMHAGNLSFFTRAATQITGLAPCYDMLPMHYAPRAGELGEQQPLEPSLVGVSDPLFASAWRAALDFWQRAASHAEISSGFRSIAAGCADNLARLSTLQDLVPQR